MTRSRSCPSETAFSSAKTSKYEGLNISFQESNERYNEIIREVAQESKAILVDHENIWKSKSLNLDEYLLPDQIHMSQLGHQIYFEEISDSLIKNISL